MFKQFIQRSYRSYSAVGFQPKLDYNYLSQNATAIEKNMFLRNHGKVDMKQYKRLNQARLIIYNLIISLRSDRNELSLAAKQASDNEKRAIILQGKELKANIKQWEERIKTIESELLGQGLLIPNNTHPLSPVGSEENANIIKTVGTPKTDQNLLDHVAIATKLNIIDFEQAAVATGSSFYYLQGMGAFLELALVQYAMHKAASRGFLSVLTPDIVRTNLAYGCGFQPKSGESSQIYDVSTKTTNPDDIALCLAGTAEIPLAGKFALKLLNEDDLPQKVVGFGHAFRTEAGGRGVTTKGLYRVHQFSKVELFAVTTPDQSEDMMDEIRTLQEDIFTELGLCFRILDMPTEELGASAYRKFDMEAWMPGRKTWGEV